MQQAFRARKKDPTQNVMAAVKFDLKFTYVLAGWERSAHDALILVDAIERNDGFKVPAGNCLHITPITHYTNTFHSHITHTNTNCAQIVGHFYLVDAGYACRQGFLPPYRGVRYHLSEFSGTNQPTNAKELFNLRHSSLRVTVEDLWCT
jgi:hypothetical protein